MRSLPGIGSHHSAKRQTDEWLTPPAVLEALGPFDLDPCSPTDRPWPTAARHLTVEDDGLEEPWAGRVWLNPPYSTAGAWMRKMAGHRDGIALTFARTETAWFQRWVWPHADAVLFLAGRLSFVRHDAKRGGLGHNAGAPSVLIGYGADNVRALEESGLAGALVPAARLLP